jgi:hypothetical protein
MSVVHIHPSVLLPERTPCTILDPALDPGVRWIFERYFTCNCTESAQPSAFSMHLLDQGFSNGGPPACFPRRAYIILRPTVLSCTKTNNSLTAVTTSCQYRRYVGVSVRCEQLFSLETVKSRTGHSAFPRQKLNRTLKDHSRQKQRQKSH